MQTKRPRLSLPIAAAAFAAALATGAIAPGASAAGFGTAPSAAVLGQPLDFNVPVRLEAGELVTADCISADVTVGDRRLPAGLVRVSVTPAGADAVRVHVGTASAVDEPVVAVQLTANCAATRMARRFVLLADPPGVALAMAPAAVTAPAYAAAPPLVPADLAVGAAGNAGDASGAGASSLMVASGAGATAGAAAQAQGRAMLRAAAPAGNRSTALSRDERRAQAAAARDTRADRAAGADRTRRDTRSARASRSNADNRADATQRRNRRLAATATAAPAAVAAPGLLAAQATTAAPAAPAAPRLKLDTPETVISDAVVIDAALEAVAEAASSARAAASAASASAERIAALERTVASLRAEAQGSRDMAAQLRDKLAQVQTGGRWLWPLLIAALLLAALAAWLAWRLAAAHRARQDDWLYASGVQPLTSAGPLAPPATMAGERAAGREPTAPAPFVTSDASQQDAGALVTATRPRPGPAWSGQAAAASDAATPSAANPPRGAPTGSLASSAFAATDLRDDRRETPHPTPNPNRTQAALEAQAGMASALDDLQQPDTALDRTQPLPPSFLTAGPSPFATAVPPPAFTTALPTAFTTAAMAGPSRSNATARDVSIEELIDLEQQAEFFVVLGQDDAAIELLVEHVRNTGGGSPLPYLKLLEIYRRRGDRSDYERMRTRFNHRFNAYAPEWGVDLQAGRTLEDYTGVIPRLQQVWVRPLDAMAELEALLFRKSRGELFDLPAYREVLFLYSLARDLLDRDAATGSVDLLLPLADGGEFSSTSPAPFLDLPPIHGHMAEQGQFDDRPTAPVDLDLSTEMDRPGSIFDPLESLGSPQKRR